MINLSFFNARRKIVKKLIPILLSALMLGGCAVISDSQTNTYRQITMDEAVNMMAQETGYIILDVRRPDEFAAGHIPNAINVPNETIDTAEIPELPDKDQLIMVYCRSGRRSKEASEKLVKLGYTNIVEFGGILDWKGEIVTGQ
ncbi:MAG: rhodanese-like domain-containing protein [Clostridia bacterium]|nr:rhodanese-like domain-containing protein [Clostridia bacterium]